ncbi:MAG: hypothetical protein LBU81_04725 [Methanosarcinales archaeon]|jgi:hypothetical protein|nr:hypothetical protein [Methanosarcinales archaeon]
MKKVKEIQKNGIKEHVVRIYLSIGECVAETGFSRNELRKAGRRGLKTKDGTFLIIE